ncbi:MAG: hypothetical protein IJH60_05625, partial [Eubacterium sp.]|nr:hypothetical protein [Eubacterium sp.]
VFEGWYADEGCNGDPYTFTTMPVGGITVYAKWRQIQYRVFLHPNAEDETTNPGLNWGDEDQQMNFRISSGGTVNTPWGLWTGGTKEFVGWYTDEACTNFFNDKMELNETSLKNLYTDYDKSELTDNMDIYGNIDPDSPTAPGESGKGYNSDKWAYNNTTGEFTERDRWWITHKLDLYALWRTVLVGADGINVTYNAVGYDDTNPATEVTGKINEATTYTDPIMYLDQVEATATAASTPDNDTDYQFLHWVVQKWNGTEYVDTTTIVYPGDGFTVLASYAKITDKETGSVVTTPDPDGSYIYNLQLRAVYGPTETATPTFVDWYQNEESATTPIHQDKDKQINQLISTYDLTTNTSITIQRGHVFLGWSIQEAYENDGNGNYLDKDGNVTTDPKEFVPITYYPNLTEDDLDLKYDRDSGKYLGQNEKKEWVQAKGVAADEVSPYDAIYAVWQDVFYVVHGSDKTVEIVDMSSKSTDKDKAREAFTTGASVGNDGKVSYTNYYYGGYGLMADTTEADPAGFTLTKGGTEATYTGNYQWTRVNAQKSDKAFNRTVGDVYYLKEVSTAYLASPKVAAVNADHGKGDLTSLSGLSVVDTTIYRAGGINDTKGTFAQTFTLNQLNEDNTVEKKTTDEDMFSLEGFFTVNALSTAAGTYVLTPYWTTYDNIKVTSNSSRSITVGSDGKVTDTNTQ